MLELAGTRPIETVTVTEVVRLAGMTRGSFYNHAKGPTAVLAGILGKELEAAGEAFREESAVDGASRRTAFERNVIRVWEHIDARHEIYSAGLGESLSPTLYGVLTKHLETQLRGFLTDNLSIGTQGTAPEERDVLLRLYAAHAAHGAVGIIETWLRFDVTPERELLIAASVNAVPDWWFDDSATADTA